MRAVEKNEIQALLVPLCDEISLAWLTQLPVTASFVSTAALPNRVEYDFSQMLRLGLKRLRARGCARAGLVSSIEIPLDARHESFRFYEEFVSAVGELGLKTRDPWVRIPRRHPDRLDVYGYDAFRALWKQETRPDGILSTWQMP